MCASSVTIGANSPNGTGSMTAGRWANASAGGDLLAGSLDYRAHQRVGHGAAGEATCWGMVLGHGP